MINYCLFNHIDISILYQLKIEVYNKSKSLWSATLLYFTPSLAFSVHMSRTRQIVRRSRFRIEIPPPCIAEGTVTWSFPAHFCKGANLRFMPCCVTADLNGYSFDPATCHDPHLPSGMKKAPAISDWCL